MTTSIIASRTERRCTSTSGCTATVDRYPTLLSPSRRRAAGSVFFRRHRAPWRRRRNDDTLRPGDSDMTTKHVPLRLWLAIVACLAAVGNHQTAWAQPKAQPTLKIGVTLHPYYSWTRNVVGDLPGYEVRSLLPGEIDAGDYQPRPDDIKKIVDLD